jgi:hypothetical protein
MATKLYLLWHASVVKPTYWELGLTGGMANARNPVVDTVASGTEIQWTRAAGAEVVAWISPRLAAGITLTTATVSIDAKESHINANCGGRARLFRWQPDGTETELGGGPFSDGVEFTTSFAAYDWVCDFTDTAFNAGDRILLKLYITNVGTMGGGYTCTIGLNQSAALNYLNFTAETPTFLPESARRCTHLLLGVGG